MLEGLKLPEKELLCNMMKRAAEMSKEDLEILLAALEDKRWSSRGLAAALTEQGFEVKITALQNHRSRTCSCAK